MSEGRVWKVVPFVVCLSTQKHVSGLNSLLQKEENEKSANKGGSNGVGMGGLPPC